MLRGAVAFNEDFEENYMKDIFALQKGMTQAISHFSRYEDASASPLDGKYSYSGHVKKNALAKIKTFYRVSIATLCATGLLLFLITGNFGHLNRPTSAPNAAATGKVQLRDQ